MQIPVKEVKAVVTPEVIAAIIVDPADLVPSNWTILGSAEGITAQNTVTNNTFEGTIKDFCKRFKE